ncbi:MAG TPA: hypothetical protein VG758_22630 [Hyphomicrobiaceae bacterium]|jgi:hypothetical protein|nr:hypothetical protein [Hyphomicrobiaceae bacterium]
MRRTYVIASVALAVAVAFLGMRVITADVASETRSAPPAASIGILQMMQDAQRLEVQQYDAI